MKFIIPAETHSDDYAIELKFDALPWFEQASVKAEKWLKKNRPDAKRCCH